MLMTAHKGIVHDVIQVFDFIERPFIAPHFHHLLVAPNNMRQPLYNLINKEIRWLELDRRPTYASSSIISSMRRW